MWMFISLLAIDHYILYESDFFKEKNHVIMFTIPLAGIKNIFELYLFLKH